jgi:TfoX/Sxy family transcriptional regulator of competence genes
VAYDEKLAARVRAALADRTDLSERKMFGGLTFMVAGHMCCGVNGDELIVRLDPDREDDALERPQRAADGFHRPADARLRHRATGRPERRPAEPMGARSRDASRVAAAQMTRPVSLADARS